MCVRSSACCMHTYARMRRMHSSVRVCACVRACARRRRRWAAGGARGRPSSRYHCAHVHHYMYACAHVHINACARRMHLSELGRGRRRGCTRSRRERASTNCVSLRTFFIDAYPCVNVGMYGCIIACLYVWVCVYIYMYLCISIYMYISIYIYLNIYIDICMYAYIYIYI